MFFNGLDKQTTFSFLVVKMKEFTNFLVDGIAEKLALF
jgi:hypothetical protein